MEVAKYKQRSLPVSAFYSLYSPKTPVVYLTQSSHDTCMDIQITNKKYGYILRKLQRRLTTFELCCQLRNIKMKEDTTHATYLRRGRKP
jgi:hypothetical protein